MVPGVRMLVHVPEPAAPEGSRNVQFDALKEPVVGIRAVHNEVLMLELINVLPVTL